MTIEFRKRYQEIMINFNAKMKKGVSPSEAIYQGFDELTDLIEHHKWDCDKCSNSQK